MAGTIVHKFVRHMVATSLANLSFHSEKQAEAAVREFTNGVIAGATLTIPELRKGRGKLVRQERGEVVPEEDLARWQTHIQSCLQRWGRWELVEELLANRTHILREYLDPPAPMATHSLGVPALVKTDVVVRDGSGAIVYDWKTGRPNDPDRRQAAIYDLFVRGQFQLPEDAHVQVKMAYLSDRTVINHTFDADERAELRWEIEQEYTDLLITDAKTKEEQFPAQPNRQCARCPFQFICKEGQAYLNKTEGRIS